VNEDVITERDDDVREAVFRHQFAHTASSLSELRRVGAYYLSVGSSGEDPSDDLLSRFEGLEPPVKAVSRCMISEREHVVDRETGQRGVIFSVTAIEWIGDGEVRVEGGYYDDDQSAAGHRYRVEWRGDQWVVTSDSELWRV
jgi:hypothetical protein